MPTDGISTPFDRARLDRLMDAENIDVLLATSKHNVQYLLGGHRADFFDYMDATAVTRYLPVVIYPKGAPDKAAYVGHRLEKWQVEVNPLWIPHKQTISNGSADGMQKAIDVMKKSGMRPRRLGAEFGFLPYDAALVLRDAFPDAELVDATIVLDRQRAKKSADELKKLKFASEAVLDSMRTVIATHGAGASKEELAEALRKEEVNRGLVFEYCLIAAGITGRRRSSAGKRAMCCRSIPAATTRDISAIFAGWRSSASRMPSCKICSVRSRAFSVPRSRR
jgi:Xaa-Pro aminopeptidase